MRHFLALLFGTVSSASLWAQVHVGAYQKKDGSYVQAHYRSSPNATPYDNWSYPGNYNPYTGKIAGGDPATYLSRYDSREGVYGTVGLPGGAATTSGSVPDITPNEVREFLVMAASDMNVYCSSTMPNTPLREGTPGSQNHRDLLYVQVNPINGLPNDQRAASRQVLSGYLMMLRVWSGFATQEDFEYAMKYAGITGLVLQTPDADYQFALGELTTKD